MFAFSASQTVAAASAKVSSTALRSKVERPIVLRTLAVAACCSRASSSSRRSCAISLSWLAADELRGRAASVPLERFGAAGLRRRDLTELALERRRIAHPKGLGLRRFSSRDYSRVLRPAEWGPTVICAATILRAECLLWVKSRHQRSSM